ncbi:MAG: hypothetical protein KF819_26590 [Labilithrix sp.]|nr:hypothetical protein [Labilithrix sp.]
MSPPLRLGLVLVVFAAACAGFSGACSDDVTPTPSDDDAGGEAGSVDRGQCPLEAPAPGSTCLLPEGTTCDFGRCGTLLAQCSRGVWRFGGNTAPLPPCPEPAPNAGVACPRCWPAEISCTYGSIDCSAEDASTRTTIASCPEGTTWVVETRPCRDGGGPDVQGDAEPDAD